MNTNSKNAQVHLVHLQCLHGLRINFFQTSIQLSVLAKYLCLVNGLFACEFDDDFVIYVIF